MRIEAITFVFNEEFLLPFYFKHYENYIARFNIVYDMDSTDNTLKILQQNNNVNIIPFRFPDMMDDSIKVKFINELYKGLDDCWVLNIDADEFVFMPSHLPKSPINSVALYNVYRHVSESDLDANIPIKEQRKHGVLDLAYVKPIMVRSGLPIAWIPGNHHLTTQDKIEPYSYGAHWGNADLSFCIERRVKNRMLRQSKHNLETRLTWQHHNISDKDVINECREHSNDPLLW